MELEAKPFTQPVTALSGVGPERTEQLAKLKIRTVSDLLLHRPRRYEDRGRLSSIAGLQSGTSAAVRGRIEATGGTRNRGRGRSVFEFVLSDGTGRLRCRWWNLPYLRNCFHRGDEVFVYGKPAGAGAKGMVMDHPETEVVEGEEEFLHLNRVVPIYPLTDGLSQRWLRGLIWRVLEQYGSEVGEPDWAADELGGRAEAVRAVHFPESVEAAERARRRLGLEELVELQRELLRRRRRLEQDRRGLPCGGTNRLIKPFLRSLAFELTRGQKEVLREIRKDLGGAHPMRRLLQGDVGSGKTVVAACAALMAMESGYNVVLMAPTEVLAEQHFSTFSDWFVALGLQVVLRTGSTEAARGTDSESRGSLVVGTHTLVQSRFEWPKVGLVIIDEQHKFGVAQRERLVKKGDYPHLLVMTATPIPRTLGLTVYGDLDLSVIRERPSARGEIRTFVRERAALPKVWEFTRKQLEEGRQAYVVYPRVEDGSNRKGLVSELETVRQVFAPFRVEMLHGRMTSKESLMAEFRAGEIKVLLATSVIEVGLDVANASVMVIENADLFGLAQLHQLRGRVGRGTHLSYCILVGDRKTEAARERLQILERTTDGFAIAEADLRLRGVGELLGQDQSGLPAFRFAELDLEWVERARSLAEINAWQRKAL